MTPEELISWLKEKKPALITGLEKKTTEEVEAFLADTFTVLNPDRVNVYLETPDGRDKVLQARLDKHHLKALETWKEKNLDALYQERYNKEHPPVSDAEKKLRDLEVKIEKAENDRKKANLVAFALKRIENKELEDMVELFVGDSEETTGANIDRFKEAFKKSVDAGVEKRIKDNTTPPKGEQPPAKPADNDLSDEEFFNKRTKEERK